MGKKWTEVDVYTGLVKNEDAPVNAVGGGNIAGLGIGPQGEPGVPRKRGRKFRKLMPFILYMKRRQNV